MRLIKGIIAFLLFLGIEYGIFHNSSVDILQNLIEMNVYGMEEQDYYRERLEFDSEGNLMMTTHDKKATSNTTYRTVGWVIKRYDMPVDVPGQQCAFIKLYEYEDIKYRDDPKQPGYIYCYYYGDKKEIYNAVGKVSSEWQHQLYAYGDTVYIDSILTICENGRILGGLIDSDGNRWGEVYYTWEGIASAREWASKDSLRTHFNKSVIYPAQMKRKNFDYTEKISYIVNRTYQPGGNIRIGAGEKNNESFDVEQGIPTGKSLYIESNVDKYYYDLIFHKIDVSMKIPICVKMNYHIYWKGYDGSYQNEVKQVSRWYYVEKQVSYWILNSMDFFVLTGLEVQNYAFENEKIYIDNLTYKPDIQQKHFANYYEHIEIPAYDEIIWVENVVIRDYSAPGIKPTIPDENQQSIANRAIGNIHTRNDYFKVDETLILDSNWTEQSSLKPSQFVLDESGYIYKKGYIIPNTKKNCSKNVIYATGIYKNISNNSYKEVSLISDNSVTIHTPVCAKMTVENNKKYNQLISPDSEVPVFIINREAVLDISAYGSHNDKKGYGTRDYSQYVAKTQIKIPFEIIYKTKRISANTWFDVEIGKISFIIPIGVEEGKYDVKVRNYGLNYQTISNIEDHIQSGANKIISNYVASNTVTVEVIGRMYGLTVSEMGYRVGSNDENGMYLGNDRILPYNNTEFEGSKIDFQLRTTGNMSEEKDYIKIAVTYYFIKPNGTREKVKLYEDKEKNGEYREMSTVIQLNKNNREYAGEMERYKISDSDKANKGLQIWKGTFSVPEEVYIISDTIELPQNISKGELMLHSYKKGYIIVNMELWSVKNGVRRLSYINRENYEKGYCNMWIMEGYGKQISLGDNENIGIKMGDSILYSVEKDYSNLYRVVGTH